MKITAVNVLHVKPRFTFVKIATDEGITGWGEAVVEGMSRTVETALQELKEFLIGEDPTRIEFLWQAMYRGLFYRGGPVLCSAISGVDQALWDILGKSLNVPVYQLLGGSVRSRIRMYKHVIGDTTEEAVQSAKQAVAEGFTMVKAGLEAKPRFVEGPAFIAAQVERMEAIREAIGPHIDFAIDFHGRVSPTFAIQLAKRFEKLDLLFIEEPCLPENVDAMVTVARSTSIPIATGERLYTKWEFRELLEKQAAAIVQPDLAHCGGISEGRRIAAMAEVYYAGFAPHNPLGPINLAASLQVSAHAANFVAQEHVTLGEGYLKKPFEVNEGYIELSDQPGLGIEVDEIQLKDMMYEGNWRSPRWFHDDDGSVADW
ncbi:MULTISPECIES: galactonate dehydratase [Paenibacillus]|uniref:galactonate dehydratase n=1 Tax=Paenibacillus TaxID=44249 RepID=UPI000B7E88B9|nr:MULTISPECIES: galactonate dehydratase [unclassified Paenibacillus]OXL87537.1 galactonate dehydratase [Paenibacillus sp. SSG-1]